MALTPGTRLGQYEILSAIGAGGMGEVYRAKDSKLGREVAIKVLPEAVAQDAERLARFEREARTLATLNHPNIVTIFAVEEAGGARFLAMELVEGETLDTVIASGGLPLSRFFEISVPLAEALSAAHERGIVHRDLKPGNVMVTREGRVKVLDFGLAKLEGPHSDPNLTNTPTQTRADLTGEGQVFGTVAYMSPEQARGGKVDARSDVFSLGVVLYQLLTGERPFQGGSAVDMISSILRDKPPSVTDMRADLPPHLGKILRRCLEKDPRDRYQTSRDVYNELKELRAETSPSSSAPVSSPRSEAGAGARPPSGPIRADEGFWVAVLPFKYTGGNADVTALAEGLSEEIVAGLSRFSYLRVITSGSTQRYADEAPDLRVVGKDLGARYVMNGNLRQVGARLRVAVQLVDTTTGAHLWADNYERTFSPESVFELQDELVPRIVSTVADSHGVLLHSMSEALRSKSADQLSPYEAVLRSFGYFERVNAEELAAARSALELAVRKAPGYADAWAMLALLCAQEYGQGYSLLADSLAAGSIAARRAVEAGPSNHLAHSGLAQVLFLQKEFQAFRNAAARAVALNPMDGATVAAMGILLAYAGDWEHGCAVTEGAMRLNPHFPGWYRLATIVNAYRTRDYRAAIDAALRIQMPGYFWTPVFCAAAFGQLDERESARKALGELLAIRPGFGSTVREEFGKWHEPELVEHFIDGLRKAGLDVPALAPAGPEATPAREPGAVAIAVLPFASPDGPLGAAGGTEGLAASDRPSIVVLPFANMSPDADNEYFSDGLTEEIIADLSKVRALSVISRTSAMQLKGAKKDVRTIGRELSVRYVLEGGVRKAGDSLRITAQLLDAQTDAHLWSDKYSGTIDDVFEVQERVSREIVRALNVTLTSDEHRRLAERPIASVRAFDLYLQARQEVRRMSGDALERASRLLSQAVEIEGETPPLLALMAWAKVTQVRIGIHRGLQPLDEAEVQARALLERAPDSPAGHALLGYIAYERGHLPQAVRHFKRALEREPNDADALLHMGISYIAAGQNEQARATGKRIVASDPLASVSWMLSGATGWFVGRFDESLVDLQRGLELDPQSFVLRWCVGYNCAALGQIPEAARHAAFLRETGPDVPYTRQLLALLDGLEGRKQAAMESLVSIDVAPLDAHNKFHLAESFGLAGETDRALDVLEQAVAQGFYPYPFIAEHCPFLAPLRPLPRFAGILAKAKERADSFQKSENGPDLPRPRTETPS